MDANEALRKRSGSVCSTDPLVSFLYILMRDHVPAGVVEGIVRDHAVPAQESGGTVFTNGYLAFYAKDVADRLSVLPEATIQEGGPSCTS